MVSVLGVAGLTNPVLCSEFADNSNREGDLYIRSVCFSPDGTLLATGAEDRQIKVCAIFFFLVDVY